MKNILLNGQNLSGLLAMAMSFATVATTQATTLYSEPFNVDGTMLTDPYNDWVSISGTGTNLSVLATTGLSMGTSDQDYASPFAAQTGDIYLGFDLSITTLPALLGSSYITGFRDGTGLDARLFVTAVDASTFTLGVSIASNTITSAPPVLSVGGFQRVVLRYNPTADTISLWVGTFDFATPAISATGTDASTSANQVFLRQADNYDNGDSSLHIKSLVVTDDFAGAVAPVPEPGTVALVGLGLGVALYGMRRRSA